MKDSNPQGGALVVVLLSIALISALSFGVWAFSSRQNYKNNIDSKVAEIVDEAVEKAKTEKDNEFVEKEKQPLKEYQGPAAYGSILIKYPKTWSAYIDESAKSSAPLGGIFHPDFVPAENANPTYALRIEIKNSSYDSELKQFDSKVKNSKVAISPFRVEKVTSVLGSKIDGELDNQKKGSMVLLPLRDKTLKIWTESEQFLKDFVEIILPNLSFSP